MKVAKRFRWEAAHRLPWHEGQCRNLHGHSYRMFVELEGPVSPKGMVMDFQEIKRMVSPLVETWDHAMLVSNQDDLLLDVAEKTGWKAAVLPFDTTVENLCAYVAGHIEKRHGDELRSMGILRVRVRMEETETCYAEVAVDVGPGAADERTPRTE